MSILSLAREQVRTHFDAEARRRLRPLQHLACSLSARGDLKKLATLYGTDKWGDHWYAQHYDTHFRSIRRKRINLLEIGIGGYDHPMAGGASLRMWRTYFSRARVYGLDIEDKSFHDERRIKTYKGSQEDEQFLSKIVAESGPLHVIIDDGSHLNAHVLKTFQILFPLLANGGIYVIEDLQTSYWRNWGGGSPFSPDRLTSMEFLKKLVDGLNFREFEDKGYAPTYFDEHITSLHFYHNIAFIYKGDNDEPSNLPSGSKAVCVS